MRTYSHAELHSPGFNQQFFFDGRLGAFFDGHETIFRLWAPTAQWVSVILHSGPLQGALNMSRGDRGQWEVTVPQILDGVEYTYQLKFPDGHEVEAVDPYARAVTANGERGVVVDVDTLLGPANRLPSFGTNNATSAIIYEAHVRDLTIAPNNGITHKGKFLGLAESGTRTDEGNLSGLDYLASLGITHVQLLPVFDFGSVDETGDLSFGAQYNWGYDPIHYNVPEGSYATDPYDAKLRLREFRELIDALHRKGIRVIMDVVYNHVYDTALSPLEQTVPGYYFRMTEDGQFHNGTGCGNETASEQLMMRKFIIESVVYWTKTFGLDGFRFDLMGIHDVVTINAVRKALDEIDPSIIIIGEGWEMGNHPEGVLGANQTNSHLVPRVGMFNDYFRDIIKGSNFTAHLPGFVSGCVEWHDCVQSSASALYDALLGTPANRGYLEAAQSVIYNEAHDNWTMYDKLRGTHTLQWASDADIVRRHELGTSLQYVGRGIIFIHAGQEFLRTKNGDENSYKSSDHINAFDYDRAAYYRNQVDFVRGLNGFRKRYAWLRESDYDVIKANSRLIVAEGLRLSFRVENGFGLRRDALVLINADYHHWVHPVAHGDYRVHINDGVVNPTPSIINLSHEFVVPPLRLVVLEHLT